MKRGPAGRNGGMPRRGTRQARTEARQAREQRAREDYHDPTAGFAGAPPAKISKSELTAIKGCIDKTRAAG